MVYEHHVKKAMHEKHHLILGKMFSCIITFANKISFDCFDKNFTI